MAIRFDGPSSIGLPAHTPQTAEQIFERYKDIVDPAEVDLFLFEIREFQAESVEEDEQPGAERSCYRLCLPVFSCHMVWKRNLSKRFIWSIYLRAVCHARE